MKLFLCSSLFFSFYLYTPHQIQVFAFDEGAPFNAKTFPIYLVMQVCSFLVLRLFYLTKNLEVDPTYLNLKKQFFSINMIVYGATILKVGFFLSTSLFLVFILFLGKKVEIYCNFFFPFCCDFYVSLHGVLLFILEILY